MKIIIDAQKELGGYIDPTAWQNSTLRYTPPEDFPAFLADKLGRAKVMRTWITLDEYWDRKTGIYYPDYEIGKKRCPNSELHYLYDWEKLVPAPSGTRFEGYLTSHARNADELMLNVRRLEREVSDGLIPYERYEEVFERAVEYCKELAPNIRYIECCNEVDIRPFGLLTAEEYLKIYERAFHAVKRLNKKYAYPIPLEIGGFGIAHPFANQAMWERFLTLLAKAGLGEKPIDFYSFHYYHEPCEARLARGEDNTGIRELGAIERLKLLMLRHKDKIRELGLPNGQVFLDELGKEPATGAGGDSLKNAAHTLTYLIAFADPDLSSLYMFPWCSFHNPELQISYTQFLQTKAGGYAATPNGISLMMLHKMTGTRRYTDVCGCTAPDAQYRAQAVSNGNCLWVVCTNPGKDADTFDILIENVQAGTYEVRTYLCDSRQNNCVTSTGSGELTVTDTTRIPSGGTLAITLPTEPNGFALFEIVRV